MLRRKKVYLALLLIGGVALLIDRFVLTKGITEPHAAVAMGESASVNREAAAPAVQGVASLSIPEVLFPRGLPPFDQAASDKSIRALFAPPVSTSQEDARKAAADKDGADANRAARPEHPSAATFTTRHHLEGVLVHQRLKIAVVDGAPLCPGQSIDGCTLVHVSGNEARFECHDGQAVLTVADADTLMRY